MSKNVVLVLNCGSSSLKFSILDPHDGQEYLSGIAECFHLENARIHWIFNEIDMTNESHLGSGAAHKEALSFIVNTILASKPALSEKITAIGHRVVHGGRNLTKSSVINNTLIQDIHNASSFAPLHNPAHIVGINEALTHFPHLSHKNVAVFDTAFHQTMPEESYLYALPYYMYKEHGIRRYGAHGTSHRYITQETAKILKKPASELHIITCHLGNGSSIAAILNGQCVDTSMGLTPLEGLVMGTRSGDIDPSIIFFLHDKLGMNIDAINHMLTQKSGLLGLTEVSSDCRYLEENYTCNANAKRAMDVYCHRLAKYIASYTALMEGHIDAITFTGGIGENSYMVRQLTLNKLSLLGIRVDYDRNVSTRFGHSGFINQENSLPILVLPTKEELLIAQDTMRLIG
ncbi:Acetate kinase [Candidatus Erwinia haradaeae]|uniref:Acetate kinase n=1 Tax=Candidatus Erwinia haradaeae TaxID=1922217 RepID=A0A451DCB5_9GAMM|nr:acetate kinase [Candidatus Erwinia haradaeae]VFP84005.1 Acetate kinase [Candidatus Erwinia haradaeae]